MWILEGIEYDEQTKRFKVTAVFGVHKDRNWGMAHLHQLGYLNGKLFDEGIDAAEYRAFVMRLFDVTGRAPVVDEYIHTNYLARLALADVKELKHKLEDIKDICDGDSDILNIIGE